MCKAILFLSNCQTRPASVETVVIIVGGEEDELSQNCWESYKLQATSCKLQAMDRKAGAPTYKPILAACSLKLAAHYCSLKLLAYLCTNGPSTIRELGA